MLVEGLYSLLAGSPELAAIVGSRITPVVLPMNPAVPAITFAQISSRTLVTFNRAEISVDQIEINVWASSYHDAACGKQALHALLDMYQGTLSEGTVVMYTSSTDGEDDFEKDSLLYRCRTTYTFVHR